MTDHALLFRNEEELVERASKLLETFKDQPIACEEYERLLKAYKKLLRHTKMLIRMGDIQQGQLTTLTEELQSDKLELQEVVRTTEKRLAEFLEAMPVGIFVIDGEGNSHYANQRARQILGQDIIPACQAEQLPEVYHAYLSGTHQLYPPHRQPIVRALQGESTSIDDIEIHHSNRIIPLEVWGCPILNEEGKVIYAIAVFQDMTERKKLEEEGRQITQKLIDLNTAYQRFVPNKFLEFLNRGSIIDLCLGDQIEKEMTVLFSDIRNFTTLSETFTPQDNFEFLNIYLGQMEPVIHQYYGVIDKYVGDAIMGLFPTRADDALQAAITMLKVLERYNQLLLRAGFEALRVGIGLNTGPLMLGIIGGQQRMEGTVIADAVNLAARIEELTKGYGVPLLITEQTYMQLADVTQYHIREIDHVTVKGKKELITVYEVFDADPPAMRELKQITLPPFQQGVRHFHSQAFEQAKYFFEQVLQLNPADEIAQIYLVHCQNILTILPSKVKILIVEDVLTNARILSAILKKGGHHFEILFAGSGEHALEIAQQESLHLILLDVVLPGIDGFETCRHLKSLPSTQSVPVIFVTSLSEPEDIVKAFEAGGIDFITKPFRGKEILARVKVHLNIRKLQQQLEVKSKFSEIHNSHLREIIENLMKQSLIV